MHSTFLITPWVVSCLNGFKLKGWDLDKIFEAANVDSSILQQPTCDARLVNDLFKSAAILYKPPVVGIEARKGITPNSLVAVSLAALSSPSLSAALGQMIKYNYNLTNCIDFFLEENGGNSVFGFQINHDTSNHYSAIYDAILCTTMKTCRFIQPSKPVITLIEMAQAKPTAHEVYEHYFKAPIRWNATRYALHFDTHYFNQPSIHFNQPLMDEHERSANTYFSSHNHKTFADELAAYLYDAQGNAMSLSIAAHYFSTGTRTLQRKLNAEGTSFCRLLEDVRKAKAEHLLRTNNITVTEVTFELGFSDTGNFSRAFKRWFDCSPSQYQKRYKEGMRKMQHVYLKEVS